MNRRTILTPDMYAEIPALIEQGLTEAGIAERFGVTPGTLVVQCSRRGISLSRVGPRGRRRTLTLPEAPLDLSDTVMIALRHKAKSMGTDPSFHLPRDGLLRCARNDAEKAGDDLPRTLRRLRSGRLEGRAHRQRGERVAHQTG
jgi:hypothetical protein